MSSAACTDPPRAIAHAAQIVQIGFDEIGIGIRSVLQGGDLLLTQGAGNVGNISNELARQQLFGAATQD